MNQAAKHIIFIGRVQGVGFRFTAFDIANRYQLTGYVCNLADGTVEMIAQGNSEDIENCSRDIQQTYEGAIKETKVEEVPINPEYRSFKITF